MPTRRLEKCGVQRSCCSAASRSRRVLLQLKRPPSGSAIFPTSRTCRPWSRITFAGKGKGWFEERLGPGVKIEWYRLQRRPERHGGDLRQFDRPDLCRPQSGAQRLCQIARGRGPHRRRRRQRRRGAGGAGRMPPLRQACRFPRQENRARRSSATRRTWRRAPGLSAGGLQHHPDRRRRAGGADQPIPISSPCSRAKQLDAVWTVEPWVSRLELGGAAARCWSRRRTPSRPCWCRSVEFLRKQPRRWCAKRFVAAHRELTEWIKAEPGRGAAPGPRRAAGRDPDSTCRPELVARAWSRIDHHRRRRRARRSKRFVTSAQHGRLSARRARSVRPDRGSLDAEAARPDFVVGTPAKLPRRRASEVVHIAAAARARAGRRVPRGRRGRVRLPRRAERLRQVHAARHHRRPRPCRTRAACSPTASRSQGPGGSGWSCSRNRRCFPGSTCSAT